MAHLLPKELIAGIAPLAAWLVLLLLIFVPLERVCGRRRQDVLRRGFGADVIYYFLSGLLPKLVLVFPVSILAGALHQSAPGGFYAWMEGLPLAARMAGALVVSEIGSYWGHRLSHRIPLLWRFHAIHHSAEEMDWLVNSRAHPVDLLFTRLCGLAPMYLLGFAQPMSNSMDLAPVLVTIAGTLWGFFIHANVNWRLGFFEQILSTPAFHHWHHTNDGERFINHNYSAMLPWVDRLFGTYLLPERDWPERYGADTVASAGIGGQLLQPFGFKATAKAPAEGAQAQQS
jgi:sterol desaturase/sphingolipid hydroxylase (fatty acid hydroxylase superfamily)